VRPRIAAPIRPPGTCTPKAIGITKAAAKIVIRAGIPRKNSMNAIANQDSGPPATFSTARPTASSIPRTKLAKVNQRVFFTATVRIDGHIFAATSRLKNWRTIVGQSANMAMAATKAKPMA